MQRLPASQRPASKAVATDRHFPPTGFASRDPSSAPNPSGPAGVRGAVGWVGTLAGGMRSRPPGNGSSFGGVPMPPLPGTSGTDVPGINVPGVPPVGPDTTIPADGSKHESARHPLPEPDAVPHPLPEPDPEQRLNHG